MSGNDDDTSEHLMPKLGGFTHPTPEQADEKAADIKKLVAQLMTMPWLVGFGLGFVVYKYCDDYKNDDIWTFVGTYEYVWLYRAEIIFAYTVWWINIFPVVKRAPACVAIFETNKNINANMCIYKTMSSNEAVVMVEDGLIGEYNRANRSMFHMNETVAPFMASVLLAGAIWPMIAFICVCVFCLGRVLHQHGYITGYGSHATGFATQLLASQVLQGMCMWVALKA